MNAISYSLFKADDKNCHTFESFMRFLTITLRAHHVLFEGFDFSLNYHLPTKYNVHDLPLSARTRDLDPLCRAMLWRIEDCYNKDYEYVFCRDLDSLPTYRERQAVEQYIKTCGTAHAINDSISHTIPMLGGMIGFNTKKLEEAYPSHNFYIDLADCNINFVDKGTDQTFINKFIYPKVRRDTFSHRMLGMNCNQDNNCTNVIPNIEIPVDAEYHTSDLLVNHIGQGGYHLERTFNAEYPGGGKHYAGALAYWRDACPKKINSQIEEFEKQFPEIYYWHR